MAEVVAIREVLPDALGREPFLYRCLNEVAIGLTGAL
jgi:hypothetical protein